jgi:hypothetical protein
VIAKGTYSVVEARLGSADWNLQDGSGFFERKVVLIVKKEHGPARGRDVIEEGEEGFVGWLADIGVECGERLRRSGVERLPAAVALELGEGDPRGYSKGPWAKDGGLAKEMKLAEDLQRGLLKDVVCEGRSNKAGDVAAQWRMDITEELFQCGPVAGLGEKNEEGFVGRWKLRRVHDR